MKRGLTMVICLMVILAQLSLRSIPAGATAVVSVSPNSVLPGSNVAVSGSGFTPSEASSGIVLCTNVPTNSQCRTLTVSESGTFSTSLAVPAGTPGGQYQVSAQQYPNGPVYAYFTVQTAPPPPLPSVTVSVRTVSPGDSLTVNGAGWPAGAPLNVCTAIPGFVCVSAKASPGGTFSVTLTIPATTPSGIYTVSVQHGTDPPITSQFTVQVLGTVTLALNPVPVNPGSSEHVTGSGFGAGERVSISFPALLVAGGTAQVGVEATADASGSFSVFLPIPSDAVAGNYIVVARGERTGRKSTALMNVAAQPTLTLSPATVPVGSKVLVTGTHWLSNWSTAVTAPVLLTNGTTQLLSATLLTDGVGNLRLSFIIPSNAAPGPVVFTVTQKLIVTYTLSAAVTVVTLHPGIQFSTSNVAQGGVLVVYLTGFSPDANAPITVLTQVFASGAPLNLTTFVYPDSNGRATATLQIPVDAAPGTITIVASQPASGAGISQTVQISQSATIVPPPSTPTLTPRPTATPTTTPTSTPIPIRTPSHKPRVLKFRYVTLWYRAVVVGTFNHVDLQSNQRGNTRVVATVSYPNGTRLHFVEHTNGRGRWSKTFHVPTNSISRGLRTALIQVQLGSGNRVSLERSLTFTLFRR